MESLKDRLLVNQPSVRVMVMGHGCSSTFVHREVNEGSHSQRKATKPVAERVQRFGILWSNTALLSKYLRSPRIPPW